MNMNRFSGPVLCMAMLALSGCGGDGSSSPLDSTVISGKATKGPLNKGTVKVFAVNAEGVEAATPLKQGQTDAVGNFSIDIGTYKGPVVVEATGSFTDEVSTTTTVTLQSPLRAVFSNASTGKNTVAVTPLTELACTKAKRGGAKLTKDTIKAANAAINAQFGLADIVSTLPDAKGATLEQKKYAAACGTVSQLANTSATKSGKRLDDALTDVMSKMESEIENTGDLSVDSVNELNAAGVEFRSTHDTGLTEAEAPHVETHSGGTL